MNTKSSQMRKADKKSYAHLWDIFLWIFIISVGVLSIWLLYKYYQNFGFPKDKSDFGQFGDFLGGSLNPLVALAALFAVMRSIALQKTELAATNEALKDQVETARKQQRSQQFFDLIRIYEKAFDDANNEKNLEDFFIREKDDYFRNLKFPTQEDERHTEDDDKVFSDIKFKEYFSKNAKYIFSTYKNYLMLMKSLFNEFFDQNKDLIYINLFISQLKRNELRLLALFMMENEEQRSEFIAFATKYQLLAGLHEDSFRQWAKSELPFECFGKLYHLVD